MASPSFAPKPLPQKGLSLADIDAVVSAKLGTTRTLTPIGRATVRVLDMNEDLRQVLRYEIRRSI